jgi:RNA polymerase subunit RPABC4/transcription elongation factor Spt4
MKFVMCRSCGEFVPALPDGDSLVPQSDECPDCGGTEFKDNESGDIIQTD